MTALANAIIFLSFFVGTFSQEESSTDRQLTVAQGWGYGILTGIGVSLIGFLAAILLVSLQKCMEEGTFKMVVQILYALGCGALIGDSMLHILPEAFTSEAVNFKVVSGIFIGSLFFFLILQRVFQAFGVVHQHWTDSEHDHPHADHHHGNEDKRQTKPEINNQLSGEIVQSFEAISAPIQNGNTSNPELKNSEIKKDSQNIQNLSQVTPQNTNQNGTEDPTGVKNKSCLQNLKGKGTAGYLNLLSSFIHNFMDGFGVGVGFASGSPQVYIPIVVAVFVHEIPREMGDVAILLKSGFTGLQTILCNGFINVMALLGVIIGLAIGNVNQAANTCVLVVVAGNFVYIGTDIMRHLFKNKSICKNMLEFIGLGVGIGAMYLVLLTQSSEE